MGRVVPLADRTCWCVCQWVELLHLFFSQHPDRTSGLPGVFVNESQGTTGDQVRGVDGICGFGLFVSTVFVR